jgi:hypothetical protein
MIVPALPTSIKSPATNDLRTTSRSASIAVNVHRSPSFGWVTSQGMSQLPSQVECPVVRRAAIRRIAVSQASMGRMAERVGFVPATAAIINDLGLVRSPQSTKSTRKLSIRYKTGSANTSPWRARAPSCSHLLVATNSPSSTATQRWFKSREGCRQYRPLCTSSWRDGWRSSESINRLGAAQRPAGGVTISNVNLECAHTCASQRASGPI